MNTITQLGQPAPLWNIYGERALERREYDVAGDRLTIEARGFPSPWEI